MSDTTTRTDTVTTLPVDLPLEALADFCRHWQITELSIFGSALRDDFGPDSDYDLLVEFDPEAPVTFMTLEVVWKALDRVE